MGAGLLPAPALGRLSSFSGLPRRVLGSACVLLQRFYRPNPPLSQVGALGRLFFFHTVQAGEPVPLFIDEIPAVHGVSQMATACHPVAAPTHTAFGNFTGSTADVAHSI